jgi:alpha-tubulin suppressor-like RCC1 family protein
LKKNGSVITWGHAKKGGNSRSEADDLKSGVEQIFSTRYAFAALKKDGSVITWGQASAGGDSSSVAKKLRDGVVHIVTTGYAFAALKDDGSVVSWGDPSRGGDSSKALAGIKEKVIGFADPFSRPTSSIRWRKSIHDPIVDGMQRRSTSRDGQTMLDGQEPNTRKSQSAPITEPGLNGLQLAQATAHPFNQDLLADVKVGFANADPWG